MDDEKSIAEKLTEVIGKAATSVKNAVSHVVDSASEAAQHAMEANAEKLSRIPAARTGPEQAAGTPNAQTYLPVASDAVAMPMPLLPAAPPPKIAKKSVAKTTAGRPVQKAAKRAPRGKSKPSAGNRSVAKNKNKAVKKTARKPKR